MAEGQPDAPKKPADLRYVKLTTTGWTQPVSLYLLERIEGDRVWLVCRPALDAPQEDLPTFQVAGEEEKICFEHVDFSALNPGDEHPLGQPGVMKGAVMFDFLICEEPSPYTRSNMLAVCPSELRAKPKSVSLSPGAGRVEMGNGGGASMPQTPDPGVGETTGRDKLDKLLATVEGMATQLTGVVSRVAKLENPPDTRGSARRETRRGTVFFDEEEEEDSDDERPRGSQIPVRKQDERVVDRHGATKPAVERREDQIVVYVDSADGAVGGGGRGIAGLEKERKKVADAPLRRWNRIVAKCSEITEGDGGKGVMTYFKLHTHIKHHRLALKYLHSILHIARCSKEPEVLGHCANALVFLDQMVHNDGMQEVAEQVALFPESQIKYEPLGNRVFPTPEKPYGELVEPDVVAIATRASDDLEKLAARVAKANKPKPKD